MPAALETRVLARRRLLGQFCRSGGLISFFAASRFGASREATLLDCIHEGFITRTATGYALTDAGKTEARR